MNNLQKAYKRLKLIDIPVLIENDTLYVMASEFTQLELSQFEINFQAELYDAEYLNSEDYNKPYTE